MTPINPDDAYPGMDPLAPERGRPSSIKLDTSRYRPRWYHRFVTAPSIAFAAWLAAFLLTLLPQFDDDFTDRHRFPGGAGYSDLSHTAIHTIMTRANIVVLVLVLVGVFTSLVVLIRKAHTGATVMSIATASVALAVSLSTWLVVLAWRPLIGYWWRGGTIVQACLGVALVASVVAIDNQVENRDRRLRQGPPGC